MSTQAPPRKENPSTALRTTLSMDSFFVEAQSAHPVCGRKEGEARRWRSAPRAARTGRKKVGWRGMKKSGDALSKRAENQEARRRIEKQMARNRKTRNRRIKAPGPKSERAREPKSESVRARNQKACNLPTTL